MAKKKSISYSQFSQWDKCPWMWKLNYVDRLSVFTDNIHTLFGTSMHEVLQEYLKVMYTKSIKEADQLYLDEQLEDRLKKNFLEIVKENGGEELVYIPCLNSSDEHLDIIKGILDENLNGWLT